MKLKDIFALGTASIAGSAAAMAQQPPAAGVQAAMAKVEWIAGEWEGEGWRTGPQGAVDTFNVRESVEAKLGGLLYVVEGRGWREDEDGIRHEGHHAFGVFSYDAHARRYHFDAFVKEGYQTRTTPTITDNEYSWSHPAGPEAEMRYTARLTDAGEWLETGFYCRGNDCRQTFEMRLSRIPE